MRKPNLKKLDLEDPQPPESNFVQGLIIGSSIVAIPALLAPVWWLFYYRIGMRPESDQNAAPVVETLTPQESI